LFVAAVGIAATLTFRDLYNGPPLLMAIGLGAITAFLSLKVWQLARQSSVRVQNLELKASGRMTRTGWLFASLTVLWLMFTSHSAFAQWHRAWGRYELNQTEVSRADGLSGAFKARHYSTRHERALAEAFRHFELADRWGLLGVVEVKLGLAWCHLLRGDLPRAERLAGEAVALAPGRPELVQNLDDLERAAAPPVEERFERAAALAAEGKLEEAAIAFQACVVLAPESAPARFNLGGVLRRLGRNSAAIEQFEAARRLAPEDADVSIELGLAYQALGENDKALEAFKRAVALNPDSPESKLYLPGLIKKLEAK
jgi:tetratricopeptide (TPR) repeat protein